jgi:predicted peptidase
MLRRSFPGLLLLLLFLCSQSAFARETGFLNRTVTVGPTTYRYQVYVPADYNPKNKLPVILYLHGLSYRGDDGLLPTEVGVGNAIRRQSASFPAIAVFPQCRLNAFWFGEMETQAIKALDETVKEFNGDSERLYMIGLSLGGYGAWYFAAHHPGKFAAVVPISGGVAPPPNFPVTSLPTEVQVFLKSGDLYGQFARRIGKTPVWVFHGGADTTNPVSESRQMVAALKAAHGNVKYTEYPGLGHEHAGPLPAYTSEIDKGQTDPDFIAWLFAQRRGK